MTFEVTTKMAGARAAHISLFLLMTIVPFEPRFTVPIGPLHISLLEAVAVPVFVVLFASTLTLRLRGLLSPPITALFCLVTVSFISAALSEVDPARSFKFALRLGAMAAFAWLASRLDETSLRWGLRGLVVGGIAAAALALAEGVGARSFDVVLGVFREIPFNVAGVRRASAGSEYPNLGAAMIVYSLLAGVVLLRARPMARALFVLALTGGLVFTYSRGAWLAGFAGLLTSAAVMRTRGRFVPMILYASVIAFFLTRAEISQLRLGGENANDFYAATYDTPHMFAMDPSARIIVPVKVRNVGRRPWRKTDEIHLSYHLYQNDKRPLIDGPRTDLPQDILPGESVVIDTTLRAPAAPGEYLLMWDLVHEDTTWFSGQGVRPGVARIIVGSDATAAPATSISEKQALDAIPNSLAWRPSRRELWTAALRMWKSHPMFGVGADNFRWTYGIVAGKATFDTRVFSNNMFLEIGATLGTLGFIAFAAALALALIRGRGMAYRSDVALAALSILIAMSVHGLADYLLAFTGHYLVFGFSIGVLSREPGAVKTR